MGEHDYRLKSLADDELLAGLSSIVGRRNQITAEFLAYLAELDERQLFLDLGFASLFEYCVEALGLCESTAGRHIAAARVCRNHPEVFALVASGALHASALSLLRKHLTPENAEELFALCTHRSARKVEELIAARFPRPDVRDLVRRLPTQAGLTLDVATLSVVRRRSQRRRRRASRRLRRRRHSSSRRRANQRPPGAAGRRRQRNHADSSRCPRIATACISRQMVSFANCSSGCAGSQGIGCPAVI
jgi:hypothetical protein